MALPQDIQNKAKQFIGTTWSEFHIFTAESSSLNIPASTSLLEPADCKSLSKLFTSREYAIRAGIQLSGVSYAVHQYETTRGVDLVYGRSGDATSGAGACVAHVRQATGTELYVAISYSFPSLSANAVTELVTFANDFLRAHSELNDAELQGEGHGAVTGQGGMDQTSLSVKT